MKLIRSIFLTAVLFTQMPAHAAPLFTSIGTLNVPDGLAVLEHNEKPDAKTGKPGGLIVFSKAKDVPRAVFIVTWVYVEPGDKPYDALDGAVKIGNPFDPKLTAQDARPVKVGGIEGGRYEGKLPNGLGATSYVVQNGPYRLIVLLKGPDASPYKELTEAFAHAIEEFAWNLPAVPASAAVAK